MVDIFRASQYALAIVEEALALQPRPQVIWMQLGVRNDEAAKLAEANGLKVVMNRCPKIEYGRLSSEIAWMGVNTRTLTAKKAQLFGRGIQRMSLNRVTHGGRRDRRRDARAKQQDDAGALTLLSAQWRSASCALRRAHGTRIADRLRVHASHAACPAPTALTRVARRFDKPASRIRGPPGPGSHEDRP